MCQVSFSLLYIQLPKRSDKGSALTEGTFYSSYLLHYSGRAHVFSAVNKLCFVSNVLYHLGRPQEEREEPDSYSLPETNCARHRSGPMLGSEQILLDEKIMEIIFILTLWIREIKK